MNETIMLPVEHRGETIELPLTIVTLGYTYQLHVQPEEGKNLIFEKDDHDRYRVIDQSGTSGKIDKSLVEAILTTLQAL